jgi:putative oxidoreductase
MKGLVRFLKLDFLPFSPDCGLLTLRLWLGLSILCLHGWTKLSTFSKMARTFADPLGIGHMPSLALATFAEVVCAIFIMFGLFTRTAALVLAINMGVAFTLVHKAAWKGTMNGELAWIYLGGFVALLLAGAGRFSIDSKI